MSSQAVRMGIGEQLARGAYAAVWSLCWPALAARRRYMRDPAMRRERAGLLSPPASYLAGRPRVWIHGASVGEISALPPIVAEIETALPKVGVMLSAFTDTGLDAARRWLGPERTFALPTDLGGPLGQAFATLEPQALILAETELWPGLLGEARARRVPVVVVNGRLSPASVRRYRGLRPLFGPLLCSLSGVAAQSRADAERFAAAGVPAQAITVAGSSKFDAQPWDRPVKPLVPLGGRPVVVAGSTRPGDEALVLAALDRIRNEATAPDPFLIMAPRHLDRIAEVERLLAHHRRRGARRSAHTGTLAAAAAAAAGNGVDVLILDTLGELPEAYELGWVAVVGGGFGGHGGHNLLEPAVRGRVVVFGAGHRSMAGEDDLLVAAGGGVRVAGETRPAQLMALAANLGHLLGDRDAARRAGGQARAAMAAARGASRRAVTFAIERLGLIP
jgi:3-deoxy-D-manno-octulosonic-acid transferase